MTSFFKSGDASDPIYLKTRDGTEDHHERGREYLERLWSEGAPYVDPDAAERATCDLVSVFWELQLVHALREVGKTLVARSELAYRKNMGPDLFAEDEPGAWIEAVVVRRGTGPDALQYPELVRARSHNADGVVLRLRSAIQDKSSKIQSYIEKGVIKPGQATVIAISGVTLPYRFSGIMPPEIVRAVYPANNPVLEINPGTKAITDSYVEYRDRVRKSLGSEVATDVFLDPAFSHISAVLFDDLSDWLNRPDPPGAGFKLAHNSLSTTPLPDGWLPVGNEYWWRGDRLEWRCYGHGGGETI